MQTVHVQGRKFSHRPIVAVIIIGKLGVWASWMITPTLMNSWDWSAYDQRLRWSENSSPHPDIVLIGRDAESERQLGYGIWDRAVFAKMITALGEAGASVIALDFAFVGPSPPDRGGHVSDELLAQAIKDMGHVVLPLPVQIGNVRSEEHTSELQSH